MMLPSGASAKLNSKTAERREEKRARTRKMLERETVSGGKRYRGSAPKRNRRVKAEELRGRRRVESVACDCVRLHARPFLQRNSQDAFEPAMLTK